MAEARKKKAARKRNGKLHRVTPPRLYAAFPEEEPGIFVDVNAKRAMHKKRTATIKQSTAG
jgi:hypothetical protein